VQGDAAGTLVNSGTILSRGYASYLSGMVLVSINGGASAYFKEAASWCPKTRCGRH
jgi:hypothetical protein